VGTSKNMIPLSEPTTNYVLYPTSKQSKRRERNPRLVEKKKKTRPKGKKRETRGVIRGTVIQGFSKK